MNTTQAWLLRFGEELVDHAGALRWITNAMRVIAYGVVILVLTPLFSRDAWGTTPPPTPFVNAYLGDPHAQIGTWSQTDSLAPVPTAIATWPVTVSAAADNSPDVQYPCMCAYPNYDFTVRMVNQSAGADTRVGLVYDFQDVQNYSEIVFSPTRVAEVRRISAGTVTVLASNTYSEGGQGKYFDLVLVQRGDLTSVVVSGNWIIRDVPRAGPGEFLGLVTHNTTGSFLFDSVHAHTANQPFREDFADGQANGWDPIDNNNWVIANGVLKNFTVQQANAVTLPTYIDPYTTNGANVRVKMRSPYGASGNLVGLTWGNGSREVVFSRTGVAKINRIDANGSATTIATATIPTLTSGWFEVTLYVGEQPAVDPGQYGGLGVDVQINGRYIFRNADNTSDYFNFTWGHFGLVTHWSPGEFDVVEARRPFPPDYSQSFGAAPPEARVVSGTWVASGGTYDSTGAPATAIVTLAENPTHTRPPFSSVNFSYRARLLNASSTGSVGLVTHHNAATGEFYEVLFTPAGQIIVNKHVQGTVVVQATGTHTVAPNTWFDVEVRNASNKTEIHVNGSKRLSGILQGHVTDGRVGFATHSASASSITCRGES